MDRDGEREEEPHGIGEDEGGGGGEAVDWGEGGSERREGISMVGPRTRKATVEAAGGEDGGECDGFAVEAAGVGDLDAAEGFVGEAVGGADELPECFEVGAAIATAVAVDPGDVGDGAGGDGDAALGAAARRCCRGGCSRRRGQRRGDEGAEDMEVVLT